MGTYEKIYEVVKSIPKGKVATYGQVATLAGNVNLARTVGNALHANPDNSIIPCHRVVNCKGEVAEFYAFGGPEEQRRLLESEGVIFEKNGRVDLKKYGIKLDNNEGMPGFEIGSIVYGNISNASTIYGTDKFSTPRGHGFAAEEANHLFDKISNAAR